MSQDAKNDAMTVLGDDVRVVTYRRSTADEPMPRSLEAQRAHVLAYIDSTPGWQLETRFVDQPASRTTDRPALVEAMPTVRAGLADLLRL
jgi:hypothetical protein